MTETRIPYQPLKALDRKSEHKFALPIKRIHDSQDVTFFLTTTGYSDIMTFLFQLNASVFPRKIQREGDLSEGVKIWEIRDSDLPLSSIVQQIKKLLDKLGSFIDEAPPNTGPRRFGNISFRKWYDIVRARLPDLMDEFLPNDILSLGIDVDESVSAKAELEVYLAGSFGSSQRLDYGTGHELSFLAFLGCLWKLGAFPQAEAGEEERAIVLGIIEPYFELIRCLILTYTLEPAGSHGVWGLDDHFFLPYIFGSAQLSPAINAPADIAAEGSLPNAPNPPDVAKASVVERERKTNMYFSAIGFINDVKRGPFWEHSPILFDISGVKAGWAKINKGMLKMYNAEVLSKFPVIQHFPFGSLFCWEKDLSAIAAASSVHTSNQPSNLTPTAQARSDPLQDQMQEGTRAPWIGQTPPGGGTATPWASRLPLRAPVPAPDGPTQSTRAHWSTPTSTLPPFVMGNTTSAPWARPGGSGVSSSSQTTMPSIWAPNPGLNKGPRKT
ncbi:serine/threonine-protein phosphatase 2A activator 1 [Lepidopterella palustris CBS 459.81]|uniref:Serine/threonine-protein phosphatase 2A activator n=1 Tax=Lepidopterella palustris CBS 459.81 TaxID=1314670 RepID=A0A8E2EBR8_9PEZI|nr:serine/threonine-protein phosphatase 2A activator 1 [Lepidopterella palustris CBS 459.81]